MVGYSAAWKFWRFLWAICWRAVKAPRDTANTAMPGRRAELGQRTVTVDILSRGVQPVITDMRNPQIRILGAIAGIDRIEFGRRVIGSTRTLIALTRLIGCSSLYQGDARLIQRFRQRGKRHAGIVGPAIGIVIAKR